MSGRKRIRGGGSILDKLPVELHIPGYNYCGPGTKLQKRLARGDKGINLLDEACKEHDIAYSTNNHRHTADLILADKAKAIRGRRDIGIGQRIAAFAVDKAMRTKVKMGLGMNFRKVMNAARRGLKGGKRAGCLDTCIKTALSSAKSILKRRGVRRKRGRVKPPRVLPIPNTSGGIIPFLIPALAGLSAIGSLAGGASTIARTINAAKNAQTQLDEAKRHNRMMEAAAIGKGLHLKPYRKGLGLFITNKKKTSAKNS